MDNDKPRRVALYMRVSSDEQAERGTIDDQRTFLRRYADLYSLHVVDTYEDDGVTGLMPMGERPAGRRLIADARCHRFDEMLVFNVKRLSRRLSVLLDTQKTLEGHGVAIKSVTEPFDTSTPTGRFMLQLLGSMAELDRESLLEGMVRGRDRAARNGKWTDGPIPLGYDLDDNSHLVPSERNVDGLGITEAELVRDLYRRIADGSTTVAEARRLQALGIPCVIHYPGGGTGRRGNIWHPPRLLRMLKNTLYRGVHLLRSKQGTVERPVCALVSDELWQQTNEQLRRNRSMSKRNAKRSYLLRGLIRCDHCNHTFAGKGKTDDNGKERLIYRCTGTGGAVSPDPSGRCNAKEIPAPWIENEVWRHARNFILNPEEALAEAQRQLRDKMEQSHIVSAERQQLAQKLNQHEAERERVLVLYRRGVVSLEEAERQLAAAATEAAETRGLLDGLTGQMELLKALEERVVDAGRMLMQLRERLAQIEATDDQDAKRHVIEMLVREIRVTTTPLENGRKSAQLVAHYIFGRPVPLMSEAQRLGITGIGEGEHLQAEALDLGEDAVEVEASAPGEHGLGRLGIEPGPPQLDTAGRPGRCEVAEVVEQALNLDRANAGDQAEADPVAQVGGSDE